jgi:hypothetical protein
MDFTYHCIDDVLSLIKANFGEYVDRIYPIEHEIKDTTATNTSASYLDLHLEIDSEGRLIRTKLYDKKLRGTIGSVASLLAATLYQGNPDMNHKLWNIVSTEG